MFLERVFREMADDEKKVKQSLNVERRTWDKDEYAARAAEREERELAGEEETKVKSTSAKEEFVPAAAGAAGPMGSQRAFLKKRDNKVDLDKDLGKTQMVNAVAAPDKSGGFYCEVCECNLKDSVNYLDHINGKRHQRKLGYSMRVERSTVSQVKGALAQLKRKKDDRIGQAAARGTSLQEYDRRQERLAEEEEARKESKRQRRAEARAEEAAAEQEGMDPEMMAMMGFGGFGGPKK